jgi:hypothetical protein
MDNFYTIVVVVAVVVLVLILIGIGMMLQTQNKDVTFPLYANECPDAWAVDGSGCVIPSATHLNYPSKPNAAALLASYNKADDTGMYNVKNSAGTVGPKSVLRFNRAATTCQKKAWANSVGVSWDGITNYNKCR